jgi:serine/threonine protein kinase
MQKKQRVVAIKVIELDTLNASQVIEATDTFNRELGLLSGLDHAHLPSIHEHFIDATHWYLVMDYIAGEPLDVYLASLDESALPLKEVIAIGLQLCDVLRYLHQQEPPIIFRDVKPGNIMRAPGGHLYLIDFGIARRFKPGQSRDTTPLGSPGFAAPEQYGREQSTVRTDIYGLGATLYYLLTGYDPSYSPFRLPPVEQLCPSLPSSLVDLITSMLSLDPVARPADMAAVQQALLNMTSLLERERVSGSLLPTRPARPHRLSALLKSWFSMLVL